MTARLFTERDAGHWGLGIEVGLRQKVLGHRMIALRLGYWWAGLRWREEPDPPRPLPPIPQDSAWQPEARP